MIEIIGGDVREVLPSLKPESFDACLTDPPYAFKFMGKDWDRAVPGSDVWCEVLRVLRPGAHILSFGGTRTFHRLTCAIEDGGFEIRDCLMWLYGTGFPKSLDISKAIDKAAGADRKVVGIQTRPDGTTRPNMHNWAPGTSKVYAQDEWTQTKLEASRNIVTAPATDFAKQWQGYGTALKPAWEPIVLAMKPFAGTFAENALEHGVAGINIDRCRVSVGSEGRPNRERDYQKSTHGNVYTGQMDRSLCATSYANGVTYQGRWPANVILDEETGQLLNAQAGDRSSSGKMKITTRERNKGWVNSSPGGGVSAIDNYGNKGGASRFFYCAKAAKSERGEGNNHPTVKPLALVEYLARLILPPANDRPRRILVPFAGSGSEIIGATMAGWEEVVGIEISSEYCDIARRRIEENVGCEPSARRADKIRKIHELGASIEDLVKATKTSAWMIRKVLSESSSE